MWHALPQGANDLGCPSLGLNSIQLLHWASVQSIGGQASGSQDLPEECKGGHCLTNLSLPSTSPYLSASLFNNQFKGWHCLPTSSSFASVWPLINSAGGWIGSACHWLWLHFLLVSLSSAPPAPMETSCHLTCLCWSFKSHQADPQACVLSTWTRLFWVPEPATTRTLVLRRLWCSPQVI